MDKESFTHFLKQAHTYCIPRLIKLTHSKADAEDVFMESIHQFWQDLQDNKVKHKGNLKAFIYISAKNKWLNIQRKEKGGKNKVYSKDTETIESLEDNKKKTYSDENFDPLIKAENQANKNLKDENRKKAMNEAMKQLDKKCQSLLIESIAHKKKLKDLQKSLGFVSINAIKMAKSRCRKTLLQKIAIILNSSKN
ncbi:MAG: sigma-70 family RNA polymerase sigma factor [Chitinophagales bacterium]